MASLKVWHFFSNPLELSDSLFSLSWLSPTSAEGYVDFTSWGLPDTSVIVGAPAEYIVYLRVGLRKNNTDKWTFFVRNFRYNSKAEETNNILIFMPFTTAREVYEANHLVGTGTVTLDSDNNRWRIHISALAYLANGEIHSSQDSAVSADAAALQGVNIYY